MARKATGETLRQREAFEYYFSLGDSRNLSKVAEEFNVSKRTVELWSRKYGWQERITQKNIEISRLLSERMNEEIVTEKARYRALIKAMVSDLISELKKDDNQVKIKSVTDLEKIIKLDLLLMGEATDNTTSTVEQQFKITAEDKEDLKKVVQSIKGVFDGVELDTLEEEEEE